MAAWVWHNMKSKLSFDIDEGCSFTSDMNGKMKKKTAIKQMSTILLL